jgi:hypothetical protein
MAGQDDRNDTRGIVGKRSIATMRRSMPCWWIFSSKRTTVRLVRDLDNTDIPLHGMQEGRFYHGYYKEHCYLPLYVFCGRHLLLALQTYVPLARTRISKRSVPGNSVSRKLRTRPCQVLLSLVTSLNLKKRRRASELSPRSRRLPYYGGSFFATPQQKSCRLISTGNSAFPVTGVIPG